LTVHEFLEKADVWAKLLKLTTPDGFDANTSLLRAKILMLKATLIAIRHGNPELMEIRRRMAENAMRLAFKAEHYTGSSATALLDEFDNIGCQIFESPNGIHWSAAMNTCGGLGEKRPISFLTYAIQCGLTLYVKSKLHFSEVKEDGFRGRSPLDYATWRHPLSQRLSPIQPAMVQMLFEAGYGPNDQVGTSTPWLSLLGFLNDRLASDGQASPLVQEFDLLWVDICKLFLLRGADVKVTQLVRRSVWDILKACFEHLHAESVLGLKKLIIETTSRSTKPDSVGWQEIHSSRMQLRADEHDEQNRQFANGPEFESNLSQTDRGRDNHYFTRNNNRGDHRQNQRYGRNSGEPPRSQPWTPTRGTYDRSPHSYGIPSRRGHNYRLPVWARRDRSSHGGGWRPY
jgi:hypothetical protein